MDFIELGIATLTSFVFLSIPLNASTPISTIGLPSSCTDGITTVSVSWLRWLVIVHPFKESLYAKAKSLVEEISPGLMFNSFGYP